MENTDTRQLLVQEGFTSTEVNRILKRAAELQTEAEQASEGMSRGALEAGAQAAGIPREIVAQAIQEVRAEQLAKAAQRAARRRLITLGGVVVAGLLLVSALFSHSVLNRRMAEVEEKRAQLENVLQRRHDLIPNLLAIAKTSAAHEQELIASLTNVYQQVMQTQEFERRQRLEQDLGEGTLRLMTALRANPDASSMVLFVRLSDELAGAENRISVERKRYNEAVAAYNRTARSFPVALMRPFLGFPESTTPFEAQEEARQPLRF